MLNRQMKEQKMNQTITLNDTRLYIVVSFGVAFQKDEGPRRFALPYPSF